MDRIAMVIILVLSCVVVQNRAQMKRQQCMDELQPCLNYLNGNSRPPETCCQPLDNVMKSVPECLCSFMTIQGANGAEQAGVNVTEAQTLPARCGQRINPLGCITGTSDRRTRNSDSNSANSTLRSSSLVMSVCVISMLLISRVL